MSADSMNLGSPGSVDSVPTNVNSANSTAISLEESYVGSHLENNSVLEAPPAIIKGAKVTSLKGKVTYTWSGLSVEVPLKKSCMKGDGPTHKRILHDVVGCVKSGEIWALMGSSGAGKTTLLNVLNCRTSRALHVSGERCINGSPVGPEVVSSISAYVQQDDLLFPRLTVREHLMFCAALRLPPALSKREKRARVDEVLQELGLWHIQNNYIGSPTTFKGISGGEKKRLAFAAEILTDPNILFADEPTSGLDSFMALAVTQIMNKMAARGKIIICTIHQPSSEVFNMFDNLYLLTEGRLAYAGPREDAVPFFSSLGYVCPATHNPADYYLHQLAIVPDEADECRAKTAAIADAYEKTEQHQDILEKVAHRQEKSVEMQLIERQNRKGKSVYAVNSCRQLRALMWRHLICTLREPMVCGIKFIQHIILGFVVGIIFFHPPYDVEGAASITGSIMMALLIQIMLPMYAVICTFSEEIPIFLREHWNGLYRTSMYFLSRSLVELPLFMIFPWLFFPQIWWLVGLTGPWTRIIPMCLTLVGTACCSVSLGYMCVCWSPNIRTTLQALPMMMQPSIIFSGFFLDETVVFKGIPYIKYLSIVYYGSENLMLQQWESVEDVYQTEPFVPELFGDGPGVIDYYNYTQGRFYPNFVGMAGLFILPRIVAYLGLVLKTRR